MKLKKSGFVLLETLICLAVLGILFPLAQKYISALYQNFQDNKYRFRAAEIAYSELSRMESALDLGRDSAESETHSNGGENNFLIQSKIEPLESAFYQMTVNVQWRFKGESRNFNLSQFYVSGKRTEAE